MAIRAGGSNTGAGKPGIWTSGLGAATLLLGIPDFGAATLLLGSPAGLLLGEAEASAVANRASIPLGG